jgi:FkbM family methyltransferase
MDNSRPIGGLYPRPARCDAVGVTGARERQASMSVAKLLEFDDGLKVFASSRMEARFIYDEIFRLGCYDRIRLPEHSLVIDAGANIGLFALFVKLRHPDAEILAFEPAPESARILRQNIDLHGLDGVRVTEIALGSTPHPAAPFTYYPAIPGNSTRYPQRKGPAKAVLAGILSPRVAERLYKGVDITVPVERLSAFLRADRPVDLLKIDVEGGEADVLRGIDPGHWPLIRQVIIEVDADGTQLATVCELLTTHGFDPSVGPEPPESAAPTRVVHALRPD